jgi:hypothetical protein
VNFDNGLLNLHFFTHCTFSSWTSKRQGTWRLLLLKVDWRRVIFRIFTLVVVIWCWSFFADVRHLTFAYNRILNDIRGVLAWIVYLKIILIIDRSSSIFIILPNIIILTVCLIIVPITSILSLWIVLRIILLLLRRPIRWNRISNRIIVGLNLVLI